MSDLTGLRVLLVEDEAAVALLIEDMLVDLGCDVIASVAHVDEACQAAAAKIIDFALLDVNLGGSSSLPVAVTLRERGVPFIFSTGYGADLLPLEFQSTPSITKPYVLSALEAKIRVALGQPMKVGLIAAST